jgi:thiol:disulfide interchange protein DsbA
MPKRIIRLAPVAAALLIVAALIWQSGGQEPSAESIPVPTSGSAEIAAEANAPAPASSEQPRIVLAQAAPAAERRFELGTHYERLSPTQPTSSGPEQIEVAEIFWYGCPHCFTFEPYLQDWRKNLPSDVSFVRIPAVWNELLKIHARAYYTAEALNRVDELQTPLFREIHVNRNGLDSIPALQSFFSDHGVEPNAFMEAYESFAVFTKMQRADELARRYRISSVPAVVVNGKYTTNATMAGSYPNLLEVINELVAMERAGE